MTIPGDYPVLQIVDELKRSLSGSTVAILEAPPGAGKSTVLPLTLLGEPWLNGKKIVMLEPRRLAAKSVAERMANILGEPIAETVGYRVRFDTRVGSRTQIEVVTEGILTRMLQSDNSLEDAGLVIFDEFHERSLHADLALALVLQMQQILRPDLRILIMSATLNGVELSSLLRNAPVVVAHGKQYPVTIRYQQRETDEHNTAQVTSAIKKALISEAGDILVFLPGTGEIKKVAERLESGVVEAVVHPLYGDLPFHKQQEAILPRKDGKRKIVLATSIAETSLTIEGITIVIDSGLSRVPVFDPRSGLTRLETVRVTRDAADQRAGRAGRTAPGVCYRLWTTGSDLSLQDRRKPEILEADLAPMVLDLAQWGVREMNELTWITPPPPGAVNQARELLIQLEAIDQGGITARGRQMLHLPTHPRIAHLLLLAREESGDDKKLLALATDVAALLEERDPLQRTDGADVSLRAEALRKWRAGERVTADKNALERIERLAANWRRILNVTCDNSMPREGDIGRLLWAAYPERIAQQQGKQSRRYKLANGRMASLAHEDPLTREQWLCIAHLDAGTNEGKIFLAATVHLDDLMPHAITRQVVRWDDERGGVVCAQEKRLGPLLLESKHHPLTDTSAKNELLFQRVRQKGLRILGDADERESMQARILSLKTWRADEPWPDFTEEFLLNTISEWLTPFLNGITKESELGKLDIKAILTSILPWDLQQKLDAFAPLRMQVPTGSWIKVNYDMYGNPPVMEVRLQEMFGLSETPAVNDGKTPVLLHLLSPGFKPVQVTQDLKSFWQTTYHEVRKELRMRYPRHHWPEDPWTAEAVRGAKKRT
jgi:ATP-dependent helicase HrpB